MVQQVSFQGAYNPQMYTRDIDNIVKYATGMAVNNSEEGLTFGNVVGPAALMGAFSGGQWLWSNRHDIRGGWDKFATQAAQKSDMLKQAGGWRSLNGYKAALNGMRAENIIQTVEKSGKAFASAEAMDKYIKAGEAAKYAQTAETTKRASQALKVADRYMAQAEAAAYQAKIANPTTLWGKTKNVLGISKVNGAVKNFAAKSPIAAKTLRCLKGNGAFIAISGGIELLTQVAPTFSQLGVAAGLKQTAKSAVKVGAQVAGWAIGAKAGAVAGSFFGPIGTVVGGILGFVGGMLVSNLAGKAADKIVGKNELEIAKEKQAKQLAQQAQQNPEAMQQVLAAAGERLQAEGAETEDAKVVLGSFENLTKAHQSQSFQGNSQGLQSETAKSVLGNVNPANNLFAQSSNKFDMDKDFMSQAYGLA